MLSLLAAMMTGELRYFKRLNAYSHAIITIRKSTFFLFVLLSEFGAFYLITGIGYTWRCLWRHKESRMFKLLPTISCEITIGNWLRPLHC
jgi:hypothetical protein